MGPQQSTPLEGLLAGSGSEGAGRLSVLVAGPVAPEAGGAVSAVGTALLDGLDWELEGSFDAPAQRLVLGGLGFSLEGAVADGVATGSYLGPAGSGAFLLLPREPRPRLLCGVATALVAGAGGSGPTEAPLGLLVAADGRAAAVFGLEAGAGTAVGELVGENLVIPTEGGSGFVGTLVDGTASGTFGIAGVDGSFTAAASACPEG